MSKNSARSLVLESPRRLVEREFELPDIKDDDALLRVEACGLCGTDHEQFTGAFPASFRFIPGHEIVGTIEEIGKNASERWGVKQGERVAVEVFLSCKECDNCKSGNYRQCKKHGISDMYGFISVDKKPGLWGGYATHQYLAKDSILHKIPEGVDPVIATLFNPLGAGFRWAVSLPSMKKGQSVVIMGPGIRGLACLIAVKEAGASFVCVTGYGPNDHERLNLAKEFGADLVVDSKEEDPIVKVRDSLDHKMADLVIDVTAKAPAAFAQAIDLATSGGTVVYAGVKLSNHVPNFWPDSIIYKELKILGALGVDSESYKRAIDTIASKKYPFEKIPRKVVGFKEASDLIEQMAGEKPEPPVLHGVIKP